MIEKRKGRGKSRTEEQKQAEYVQNIKHHPKCAKFYPRLLELVNEKRNVGMPDYEIAIMINASDSVLQKWLEAKSEPKLTALIDIANGFGVSLDYLVGISDNRTVNDDIKIASSTTGLSDEVITAISSVKNNALYMTALNKILSLQDENNYLFYDFLSSVQMLDESYSLANCVSALYLENNGIDIEDIEEYDKAGYLTEYIEDQMSLYEQQYNSVNSGRYLLNKSFEKFMDAYYNNEQFVKDYKQFRKLIQENIKTKKKLEK